MNAREALKWKNSNPMVGIAACTGCHTHHHNRWHTVLRMSVGVGCQECNNRGWCADEYPSLDSLRP